MKLPFAVPARPAPAAIGHFGATHPADLAHTAPGPNCRVLPRNSIGSRLPGENIPRIGGACLDHPELYPDYSRPRHTEAGSEPPIDKTLRPGPAALDRDRYSRGCCEPPHASVVVQSSSHTPPQPHLVFPMHATPRPTES